LSFGRPFKGIRSINSPPSEENALKDMEAAPGRDYVKTGREEPPASVSGGHPEVSP
jgi:hypothetical protein